MLHTKLLPVSRARGFTVAELMIVIVIIATVFPIFLSLIVNSYQDASYTSDAIDTDNDTKQALWYMEDNIRGAHTFAAAIPSGYSDPYGPHNAGTSGAEAWTYMGDSATSRVLITVNYSTSTNALNTGRQPVFVNTATYNCTTQIYYQPQLSFVTIYFVKDSTLYRRVLTDTTTALCSGSTQQQSQSCPPYIASGSWSALCKANDEVLATQVTSFTVAYYQATQAGSGTLVDPYAAYSSDALDGVDYAEVTLVTSTKGGKVTHTAMQRMTKVNQ